MSARRTPLQGLSWRAKATTKLWRLGATPPPPEPDDHPPAPNGHIDHPGPGAKIDSKWLTINGWVDFPSGPTAKVEVWVDSKLAGRARLGLPRVDLVDQPSPFVGLSGFEFSIPLSELSLDSGPSHDVEVVAHSFAGERLVLISDFMIEAPTETIDELRSLVPTKRAIAGPIGDRINVLVFTHQLTLGGAQIYLLDLLRELASRDRFNFTVVSTLDGPLRDELEGLGIRCHLTSIHSTDSGLIQAGRVVEFAAWAEPGNFDVALLNTATSPMVVASRIAEALNIPAIWAIHESFPPDQLWSDLGFAERQQGIQLLSQAAAAVFEAEATRQIFREVLPESKTHVLPYGVDFTGMCPDVAQRRRGEIRARSGIPGSADLILCVGTIEPRKAQAPLALAFETIAQRHPNAHLALVGGRDDVFTNQLADSLEGFTSASRISVIPVTKEVADWYQAADILVCASDVESLPRTVLEAMAWGLPVLATSIFGLPELITEGRTGWLCEPRDTGDLARSLDAVLSKPRDERQRIAANARSLVLERHSLSRYGDRIEELLAKVTHHQHSK